MALIHLNLPSVDFCCMLQNISKLCLVHFKSTAGRILIGIKSYECRKAGHMKKDENHASTLFIVAVITGMLPCLAKNPANADWENVGSPGFSAGGAYQNSIVIDSNHVPYVAFQDTGNGAEASVMRYNGTAWEYVGFGGLSSNGGTWPELAMFSDDTPYLVYGSFDDDERASVKRFNGTEWEAVGPLAFTSTYASYMQIALDSAALPYVAYGDSASSNKLTVQRYNGISWELVGTAERQR